MRTYDVVVIGSGPGGYVAAIRCAQLGLTTACVEQWRDSANKPALGGTCLNVGCIPSKALLDSSHHYHNLEHLLPQHGIATKGASIDVAAMQTRKDKVVKKLTGGIASLFKKNKVEWLEGRGTLLHDRTIEVVSDGGGKNETIEARHIIIATGSTPVDISAAPVNGDGIVDSTGALAFDAVPRRLGIIGAGVIGLELGSVWNRLGSKVVLLEALDDFLAPVDRDVAKLSQRSFKKQGLEVRLGSRVTSATQGAKGVAVKYEDQKGNGALEVDKLVVAVGRRAYTEGLNAKEVGIELDDLGRIIVDGSCRTNVEGIFAVGDVVSGPMLAHKASEEGVAVAESISGESGHIDHGLMPWVIYTHPEIAWVGKNEQELAADGIEYRVGTFPYAAIGRALGAGEPEGLIKMIGDADTDQILGVHIFGAQASELVAEAVTAMAFHGSTEDLARTVHAHPTLSEGLHEAALAVHKRAIHM